MTSAVARTGGAAAFRAGLVVLGIAGAAPAVASSASGFSILYLEPFALRPAVVPGATKTADDPLSGRLQFETHGRRFELALERNSRVMRDPAATGTAYRGTVSDQPGSWARLTRIGDDLYGMVWDGADLFVIEPARDARDNAVTPPDPAVAGNVIYRLSDTLVAPGSASCEASAESGLLAGNGLDAYSSLTTELKSSLVLQRAAGATLTLSLSALGDAAFRERYASQAEAGNAILARLNNVDGIYSAQLGVEIDVGDVNVYDRGTDPFTATTAAGTLLSELGNLRNGSTTLREDGLTHLFTGRDLDGSTVGIAYIDALCRERFGVGLTEVRGRGAALESLIAAHEIGHNFGAEHDGSGACAATPSDAYIMSAQSSLANETFSQCSVDTIRKSIETAACIAPLAPPDVVAAFSPAAIVMTAGQQSSWSLTVTNAGSQFATGTAIEITLPQGVAVAAAAVAGSACSVGAGVVQCLIGSLAGGAAQTVALTLDAAAAGTFTLSAMVSAANDSVTTNNRATGRLTVSGGTTMAEPAAAPASQGGGGGGAMGLLTLSLLGSLAAIRRRLRR